MKRISVINFLSLFASTMLIAGCASMVMENHYEPYKSGALQGEGVRIEAEDGSFILKEGRFAPPFQTAHSSNTNSISVASYANGVKPSGTSLIESYGVALRHGGKKVRVYHPAATEPLYGVLALNKKMFKYATGPSARSYLIRIPDSYVHEATNGGVSVVYEPVSWSGRPKAKFIGWALWLSDSPF